MDETRTTRLFGTASGLNVDAVLYTRMTVEQVVAAELAWTPHRPADAEHSHWDWRLKAGRLALPGARILGIEHGGEMQGMVLLFESGYAARRPPDAGRPLVYVDYLEAAPWNLTRPGGAKRFQGVGRSLMQEAVRNSLGLGHGGRVGLHSLPQTEMFYEGACGMVGAGPDARYYGLAYFEFTSEQGTAFLEGRR